MTGAHRGADEVAVVGIVRGAFGGRWPGAGVSAMLRGGNCKLPSRLPQFVLAALQACPQFVGVVFFGGEQLTQVEGGGEPLCHRVALN